MRLPSKQTLLERIVAIVVILLGLFVLVNMVSKSVNGAEFLPQSQFSFHDGFYWKNGLPFERVFEVRTINGCRRRVACFQQVHGLPVYKPTKKISLDQPNAKELLIQAAIEKKRFNEAALKRKQEHQELLELIDELGLQGQVDDYSGIYAQLNQYQPLAQQGSTVYGYQSYSQQADLYGQTDLNVLYQQMDRYIQHTGDLLGQSMEGHKELVEQQTDGFSRVAQLRAMTELLKAANPASATIRSTHTIATPQQIPQTTQIQQLINNRCAECHDGSDSTRLVLNWSMLSDDEKFLAVRRVQEGTMPPSGELARNEKLLFLESLKD